MVRHFVELYGLGHKLASVRPIAKQTAAPAQFIRRYGLQHQKGQRADIPEVKALVASLAEAAVTAIEEDRADTIILGGPYFELLSDEVRLALDEAGYAEIQLVCELASAVEVAKAMVNMGLKQAPRAYPSAALKAIPRFR
jgi:Asp/Glu/hydantoin racemase